MQVAELATRVMWKMVYWVFHTQIDAWPGDGML